MLLKIFEVFGYPQWFGVPILRRSFLFLFGNVKNLFYFCICYSSMAAIRKEKCGVLVLRATRVWSKLSDRTKGESRRNQRCLHTVSCLQICPRRCEALCISWLRNKVQFWHSSDRSTKKTWRTNCVKFHQNKVKNKVINLKYTINRYMNKSRYNELLNNPAWKRLVLEILERDGYSCSQCNSTTGIDVYPKYRIPGARPWEVPKKSLITLCNVCKKNNKV